VLLLIQLVGLSTCGNDATSSGGCRWHTCRLTVGWRAEPVQCSRLIYTFCCALFVMLAFSQLRP
jgi:hypothetical protein